LTGLFGSIWVQWFICDWMCKTSEFQIDLNSDPDAIQAEWSDPIHTS
jgi:hypothetical protein